MKSWGEHLQATTSCTKRSIEAADQTTAAEYVHSLAAIYAERIGHPHRPTGAVLTDVDQKGTSLILRVHVPKHDGGVEGFVKQLDLGRRQANRHYCSSNESSTYWRRLGVSYVWIYRYADTDLVETVVQNPDVCAQ